MIWLFDLDNTLHNASRAVFPAISANMNRFIADDAWTLRHERLSENEANALRIAYWKAFGATLLGISHHLDSRAKAFLEAAHDFDDLASMVDKPRSLAQILGALPGQKVLLTNSALSYARRVVALLGLKRTFSRLIGIEAMQINGRFTPKPSARYLRHLIARLGARPDECVLVEDSSRMLKVARFVGMKTVLVTQYWEKDRISQHSDPFLVKRKPSGRPLYVNRRLTSVRRLLHCLDYF